MESVGLFYLGKSLHEQKQTERGYAYMLQAVEMMEKSDYDRKYDNLRADCNDLLIYYERDQKYMEALSILGKLEKYLDAKNPGEADSRKTLMEEFNIPANKFAGLFRQFTGKTFSEYINDQRIEYVAELLLTGKYKNVEELLKECTFISSTSLYRLFTKRYGITPQKFLQNVRLQNKYS